MGFIDLLGIEITSASTDYVEAAMPLTPELYQPFGFLHGGATLALLETVASKGAELRADLSAELPFGVDIQVRHKKSAKEGVLRGVAKLDREEPSRVCGMKQFWNVAAYDDAGDVVSEGVFVTKVVPRERLAQKERERAAAQVSSL